MANTVETDWDEGSPLISHARRAGAVEIQSLRKGVRLRVAKEHISPAAESVGGEHKAGSAVSYYQASAPTLQPDGSTSLNNTTDKGRIWVDSDTSQMYTWNGTAWDLVVATPTAVNIFQFEKLVGDAVPTIPLTKTGLTNGTWLVWVYGTTANASGSSSFTVSVTVNGITRTIVIDNAPDGTAPFNLPFHITVTGGTASITAISGVQRIVGMSGLLTVAS